MNSTSIARQVGAVSKPRILWISQNLPYPPKTGVLQRNYHLIREASRFAEIHLIAILKRDILPDFDPSLAEQRLRDLCATVTAIDIPTEQSRMYFAWVALKSLLFTSRPFTVNWAESRAFANAIEAAHRRYRFDLVYFDTISLVPYRRLLQGIPCVLNHHNIESGLFARRIAFERNPVKRIFLRQEVRKLAVYEASVSEEFIVHLTVSTLDANRLEALSPKVRTAVVANGVDVDYFAPLTGTAEIGHLVMIGGMNWFPNRDAAIHLAQDIWPRVTREMPQCRLTFVGASPPAEVLALAARDDRVTTTGFAFDVRPHVERAQIYVCPMRDGGGTRLKILDALAMGRPIVATTMALEGIPIVPDRDVLVADSPDDFVRQIRRIVEDPELGRRISHNGRAFVEKHFSWKVIGEAMQAALQSAIQRRSAVV